MPKKQFDELWEKAKKEADKYMGADNDKDKGAKFESSIEPMAMRREDIQLMSSMVQDDIDLENYIIKANFNNVNFYYFDEL